MTRTYKAVAFFDLDRTLIDINSGLLYAKYEYRQGRIRRRQLLQSAVWSLLYHMSLLDMERVYGKAVSYYRGTSDAELAARTHAWFADEVADRLQPGARVALERHRARAHALVLLTNSSCYVARESTAAWDLDDWLANIFPTDGRGRLLGTIERPLCYGAGKATRARKWADEHGLSLHDAYFYTDSYTDLPMLEAVGHAKVVNPDPRLRRVAKKRGWQVLDWSAVESPRPAATPAASWDH